jgi:hypothetical protein
MAIEVKENEDGSFDIDWNPLDPTESFMNNLTEQDIIDAIKDHLQKNK